MNIENILNKLFQMFYDKKWQSFSETEQHQEREKFIRAGVSLWFLLFIGTIIEGGVILYNWISGKNIDFHIPTFFWFMIFGGLLGQLKGINIIGKK